MRELLWVYLGRSSGLIVNLIFLPLYNRLLGPEAFGIVALVLSASNVLTLLDMGTTQRATNAFADGNYSEAERQVLLTTLDLSLGLAALVLTSLALAAGFLLGDGSTTYTVALAAGLLWAQWRLNLQLTALQASGDARVAAMMGLGGLSLRAAVSGLVLWQLDASVGSFLLTQAVVTVVLAALGNARLRGTFRQKHVAPRRPTLRDALAHLRGSRALVWSGLVGAIATQADKVLISSLMSATELTPYFLASTLASAPLSVLGAPLAQLLQIRFARQAANQDTAGYRATWLFGLGAAGMMVALPCALLAAAANPICQQWLHDAGMAERVAHYARLLLLGSAVAALGYIPYAAVMAHGDFAFQAQLATAATCLQLASFIAAASLHHVEGLCWTWAAYFTFCTVGLALRSRHLDRQRLERLQPPH